MSGVIPTGLLALTLAEKIKLAANAAIKALDFIIYDSSNISLVDCTVFTYTVCISNKQLVE
jgi:hypothetical protein